MKFRENETQKIQQPEDWDKNKKIGQLFQEIPKSKGQKIHQSKRTTKINNLKINVLLRFRVLFESVEKKWRNY